MGVCLEPSVFLNQRVMMKRLFRSVVLACAPIMVAGPAFAQSPAAAVSGT